MEAAPDSQTTPAQSSMDLMQSTEPSTNGNVQADVNPTPPEESAPLVDKIIKPSVDPLVATVESSSSTAPDSEPTIQEPTEHVEAGLSGVADFLPTSADNEQPVPSSTESLAPAPAEPQDEIMSDAPTVNPITSEPAQQLTPAAEGDAKVSEIGTSDVNSLVNGSGASEPKPEQAAASSEALPSAQDDSRPAQSSVPPTTEPSPAVESKMADSGVPLALAMEAPEKQMAESTSSLTRPRDDEDETNEPSAKRARVDEPTPSTLAEAPVTPVVDEFKRPEAPATSSTTAAPPEHAAQGTASTNGTPTSHLPPRSSYSEGTLNKLQKKMLEEKIKNTKKVKSAIPFLRPVDYMALNIPNYPNIVKQPMDLSTMEHKLKTDQYSSLESFVNDFDLMVNNCFTFNGPAHAVSVQAQTLRAYFLKQMDGVPTGDAAALSQKPRKETPSAKPQARRESRTPIVSTLPVSTAVAPPPPAAAPGSARSPGAGDTFALLPGGTPQIRRDSTAGRPKRAVIPPPPRDLPYAGSKPKRKENQVGLKFCLHVLDELRKPRYDHMTIYFREPVDPVALNIPHYFQVIKKPMDIQTITNKLKNNQYGSAEEFKADFDLLFANCFKFNPPENGVHQIGKTLQGEFDALWKTKNEWVKRHQPRSQRETPASDNESDVAESSEEEDEAEDPKEATIRALKEQLESMQNMLGQITNKRDSPKASGKKKSRSSGGASKSKRSSVSAAAAKPSAKSKAPKKPRLVSYEEKQEISNATEHMTEPQIQKLTSIITENVTKYSDMAGDDVELEIDDLPNEVQLKLLKYVRSIFPKAKPVYAEEEDMGVDDDYEPERGVGAGSKSGGGGGARKKHKPMKKKEQEDRIAQLQNKIAGMKGAEGGGGGAGPAPEPQYDSSGDDDSESSEEE